MPSRSIQWTLLLWLYVIIPGYAAAIEPVRAGQDSFVSRAIFFNSQLWILTDAGLLSSITEGADQQVDVPLPAPALDLWTQDGAPAVLTGVRNGSSWTVRQWSHGEWSATATVSVNADRFIGVAPSPGAVTILTSNRLIEIVGGSQRSLALVWPAKPLGAVTSVAAIRGSLLVGFNAGEWGGGLRRIGRPNNQISIVENRSGDSICGGLLNTDCDPVNGIAVEPWQKDCAAITIGLVHFMTRGGIVEVCGDTVKRLYSRSSGGDRISTVPFFGIVTANSNLAAVGADGIYKVAPDGVEK